MATHFSSIGMSVSSEEEMLEMAQKASETATDIKCKKGYYLQWASREGAELWLQISKRQELVGLAPFFCGKGRMNVSVTAELGNKNNTPFEGAFHGWADPQDDDPESGSYPFVFDEKN